MSASDIHAVIMAGGVGSRFWPASRRSRPKQCLPVVTDDTMLAETVARARGLAERVWVVTGADHAEPVRAAAPSLPQDAFLVEPVGRNTAPCIAWAAHTLLRTDPDAVLAILPADHHISDVQGFVAAAERALGLAREGWLVTLGVVPTRAETGYGWIAPGERLAAGVHVVGEFTEKPNAPTAEAWLSGGRHRWNSGMFFARADRILRDVRAFLPELAAGLERLDAEGVEAVYPTLPAISFDHGICEHAERVAVVDADFGWNDVGQWAALADVLPHTADGSVHRGSVLELDGSGNVLVGDGGLVAVLGVSGLAVVHVGDAVLVCPVERAQEVRRIVDALGPAGLDQLR